MGEAPIDPFDDIHVAEPTRRFAVSVRELEINRAWSWSSLTSDAPEFATSIHGQAVSEGNVCVFGTTLRSKMLDLTFNSDEGAVKSWESIKRIEIVVGRDSSDPERLRLTNLQYEEFDKKPPTATLWHHSGWILECELPSAVLAQLSEDLIVCAVERVGLEIEWPFGLVENGSGSWGFFEGSQLRGYVTKLRWSLPTLKPNRTTDPGRDAPPSPDFTEPMPGLLTHTFRSHFFGRKGR
jgi:hypothetical protein